MLSVNCFFKLTGFSHQLPALCASLRSLRGCVWLFSRKEHRGKPGKDSELLLNYELCIFAYKQIHFSVMYPERHWQALTKAAGQLKKFIQHFDFSEKMCFFKVD
jgi:hypothetical protein